MSNKSNIEKIKELDYKKLYERERKKRELLEEKYNNLNKKYLSLVNKQTAKGGYLEEKLVCNDLNTKNDLKEKLKIWNNIKYSECNVIKGTYKSDIKSNDNKMKCQIKKYKKGQFQQLTKQWVPEIIKNINGLKDIENMLSNLCEIPLLNNGTHVDKTKSVKKLSSSNYSQDELNKFIEIINNNKNNILEYAFLGNNKEYQPIYLIGAEYQNGKRIKLIFMKIEDILKYLRSLSFKINKSETVISLGNHNVISIQRKGGDAGKKSSNMLQIKLIVSKLINNVKYLEYNL